MKNNQCNFCKSSKVEYIHGYFNCLTCSFPPYTAKPVAEIDKCPKYADGISYKCTVEFTVPWDDEDGDYEQEEMKINLGDIYTVVGLAENVCGNNKLIHLEDGFGNWIEITAGKLNSYFEIIPKKKG